LLLESFIFRKATSLGFVSGILAGLVVITPAAGVVQPIGAIILGALSSIACYCALQAKTKLGYDDSLDCFGIHGIGSGLGVLLLCFFIRDSWMQSAAETAGGWTLWNQLTIQLLGIGATIVIAAVGTAVIYLIVEKTVGFRIEKQKELEGLDQSLHGEHGYGLVHSDVIR
jgi:Amt family ammonium transporter